MELRIAFLGVFLAVLAGCGDGGTGPIPLPTGDVAPGWAKEADDNRVVHLAYDAQASPEENGTRLRTALLELTRGTTLLLDNGHWDISERFDLVQAGGPYAPIVLAAEPGARPVVQGGDSGVIPFLRLRPFTVLRGWTVIGGRVSGGNDVWLDGVIVALPTSFVGDGVHVTDCILGATEGTWALSISGDGAVVAANRLRTGAGSGFLLRGDGGLVVENEIQGRFATGISLIGGTVADPAVIERNRILVTKLGLEAGGVQSVRNNLGQCRGVPDSSDPALGCRAALRAFDNVELTHNTVLSRGTAVELWHYRSRFVNNACYSESGVAIRVEQVPEDARPVLAGNVEFPSAGREGFAPGRGLSDFLEVRWEGAGDAHPSPGSALVGAAVEEFGVDRDLEGSRRVRPPVAGAFGQP